jgi:transposase
MSKHQFSDEQYAEVMVALENTKEALPQKRLQVLQLRMEGYKDGEIAEITKYSKSRVSAICCEYAKLGIEKFKQENRKGGNHRNISTKEESELLSQFKKRAENGNVVTTQEIESAYEEKVGHSIGDGQIYRVLKRHGWRKVMPRSKHPKKASDEEIESSKKLTLESKN